MTPWNNPCLQRRQSSSSKCQLPKNTRISSDPTENPRISSDLGENTWPFNSPYGGGGRHHLLPVITYLDKTLLSAYGFSSNYDLINNQFGQQQQQQQQQNLDVHNLMYLFNNGLIIINNNNNNHPLWPLRKD
ncbi:hypothetical protein ACFE04_015286 [Oxalis oulophora]